MGADGEATSALSRPGNRDDFDRLYRENYPRLLRTLYAITGEAAAAEDCVQEAFVNSSKVNAGRKSPSPAYADMNSSVRVRVRL